MAGQRKFRSDKGTEAKRPIAQRERERERVCVCVSVLGDTGHRSSAIPFLCFRWMGRDSGTEWPRGRRLKREKLRMNGASNIVARMRQTRRCATWRASTKQKVLPEPHGAK